MKSRGLHWPLGISVLLAVGVITNISVAVMAADDPSFAIEPDYYRKAVAWDSAMAQAETNAALGWSIAPTLSDFRADSGATLRVSLTDQRGEPIRDANVTVSALHNARASAVHSAAMITDGNRGYVVTLPVHRAGVWELRFDIVRGTERFTASRRVEAVPDGAP